MKNIYFLILKIYNMIITIKEAGKGVFIYKDVECINLGYYSEGCCIITPINKNIGRDDKTIDGKFWKMTIHPNPNVQKLMNNQPVHERSSYYYALLDWIPVVLSQEEENKNEKYLFPPISSL